MVVRMDQAWTLLLRFLYQRKYAEELIKTCGLEKCRSSSTCGDSETWTGAEQIEDVAKRCVLLSAWREVFSDCAPGFGQI